MCLQVTKPSLTRSLCLRDLIQLLTGVSFDLKLLELMHFFPVVNLMLYGVFHSCASMELFVENVLGHSYGPHSSTCYFCQLLVILFLNAFDNVGVILSIVPLVSIRRQVKFT